VAKERKFQKHNIDIENKRQKDMNTINVTGLHDYLQLIKLTIFYWNSLKIHGDFIFVIQ
jgi:hypothetical protein